MLFRQIVGIRNVVIQWVVNVIPLVADIFSIKHAEAFSSISRYLANPLFTHVLAMFTLKA